MSFRFVVLVCIYCLYDFPWWCKIGPSCIQICSWFIKSHISTALLGICWFNYLAVVGFAYRTSLSFTSVDFHANVVFIFPLFFSNPGVFWTLHLCAATGPDWARNTGRASVREKELALAFAFEFDLSKIEVQTSSELSKKAFLRAFRGWKRMYSMLTEPQQYGPFVLYV